MKDIEIVDIDYSGKDAEYKKTDTVDLSKLSNPWHVPEEGPFYGDSLRVIKGGLDLDKDKFTAVEGVTNLTELTGRSVYLYVELADDVLAGQGEVEVIYQKVGKPVISVKTLLQMLEDMIIIGKPVDWETQITGKPATYYPAWHSHDIQNPNELVGFGGLIELLKLFKNDQVQNSGRQQILLRAMQDEIFDKLNYTQKLLWGAIMGHSRDYFNPHGLTGGDVDLGNLANYATATPQQDAEGLRSDLYSTPAGFKRLIEESSPVSEDYVMQSELPFGYYGSGIYLPPPITGSFEGLGGDTENSAFTLEGNGWLTCLFRAFDGRVKNLYYAYKTDFTDRDQNRTPWLNTYVQYQHPVITAAGKTPNLSIDGSDGIVLMVGDQPDPQAVIEGSGSWWICAANSTFDPASHTMKPVNMDAIKNTCQSLTGNMVRPTCFKISKVGDWVYLFATMTSFQGDDVANYDPSRNAFRSDHWQTIMFRVPYANLLNASVTTITFTQINVTYDTLWRERRTNKQSFIPQRTVFTDSTKQYATEYGGVKFNKPIIDSYMNRKKGWIIVPNKNNPRQARIKLLISPYSTYRDPATNGTRAFGGDVCITYDWDVVSNTLTLSPNWQYPILNMDNGSYVNESTALRNYSLSGNLNTFNIGYVNTNGSWIPGYGYIAMQSTQTGTPPFLFPIAQFNRDGNPDRDYEYMAEPNIWTDAAGRSSWWRTNFKMLSPFGVAGFPRMYSDLYALTSGVRSAPIEIFIAENENGNQQQFYRLTEGGADDGYDNRSSLQSDFVPWPIYGRKTNSSFGKVDGLNMNIGYMNRPKRKNASSRGTGFFSWYRRNIAANPGAPYEFTYTTSGTGTVVGQSQQSDGSIILNLDLDYTLDTTSKTLIARPSAAKRVRIPKSFYIDYVLGQLGAHANSLIDICVDFFISPLPGTGGDQPYSFWSATYHLTGSPADTRMIIGMFTWNVASTGADGIRVLSVANMQYPFKTTQYRNASLTPGNNDNIFVSGWHTLASPNNNWNFQYATGLQVRQTHMEIMDFESEGPQNLEMIWYPGLQLTIVGNGSTSRIILRRRNNGITEASVAMRQGQAFNAEYSWQVFANAQWGWLAGVSSQYSGAAMDLLMSWDGRTDLYLPPSGTDKVFMMGATYVEGNWSLFVSATVNATFNGYTVLAETTSWDLRDLTDVYKNQTFYIYCISDGSSAFYEITKTLRQRNPSHILVGVVKTDDFGIVTIDRRQSFTISGFPLTRTRDMGIPISSGVITDAGTYKFIKRSELYDN